MTLTLMPLSVPYGYRNSLTSLLDEGPDYLVRCQAPLIDLNKPYSPHPALAEPIGLGGELTELEIIDLALDLFAKLNVVYGDIRLGREHHRSLYVQDTNLNSHFCRESEGIGIRIWHNGAWGFYATTNLTTKSIRNAVKQAVEKAHAAFQLQNHVLGNRLPPPLNWPKARSSQMMEFHTPVIECPFLCATQKIAQMMIDGASRGKGMPAIRRVESNVDAYGRRRIFANSLGLRVLTTHCIVDASQKFVAVDQGKSAYRTVEGSALAGGIEHLESAAFARQALRAAYEAKLKCNAIQPKTGLYDLILDPHNLALTMHESVGHPTELDRVMGFELGFAGGSFAQVRDLGNFEYGSPNVNFTAHNHLLFGPSSTGIDDEGVECKSFPIVKNGILMGFGNNIETAALTAMETNGNCRSTSWADPPIVRIPNLFLEPGKEPLSLRDLIENTERGILLLGRDSFSIDQMRANFQFGSDMAYLIENGKIVSALRDVIYQSLTSDFWKRCDKVCDQTEWQMHGVFNCGKGQPMQLGKMLHGASPARFQQIAVGY